MGSTLSLAFTYCACSAVGSLCTSCFGSTAPGTTGRKRSVLLLSMAIALALWFQYWVGPSIVQHEGWIWKSYRAIPGSGKIVYHAWYNPCEQYKDEPDLLVQCAGNAGVYRPTFLASLFFAISAVGTRMVPGLNREAWPAKYAVFGICVLLSMFVSNDPLFSSFYLWVARLGATVFVVLQQIILIDVAYNWNEDWVERANVADRISYGSGSTWLRAIIATCVAMYAAVIVGISLLYTWFDDCGENKAVITLTLLGVIALTAIQLSGHEGSLLTSSVISVYVTYLAYSICSKNPNPHCNPHLGHNDLWGIIVGLTLTAISLAWTGFSWTAEQRLNTEGVNSTKPMIPPSREPTHPNPEGLGVPFLDPEDQPPAGLVTETTSSSYTGTDLWKLNVVMALISCWVAMTLTGWGTLEMVEGETATAANPTVGRFNMAMLGISQWIVILLYVWTLLAPRLFPDREFS